MNILLTGSEGFIGSELKKRLLALGYNLHCIDTKLGDQYNLLNFDQWPTDIDLVIHLAGLSGVRESFKDPAAYWYNNIEASRRLFDRYSDTRILYASSSSAYEPDLNPYAASKYCLEELAARHLNTLGMRFHTVYSESCPRKNMFFYKLLNNELEYVTKHHRDFVHLEDLLDGILILIKKDYVKGIIDIGSGISVSIQDLAPHLPVRLNTPGEREWTCANLEKMKALGFKPKYTVEKFLTNKGLDNIITLFNGET